MSLASVAVGVCTGCPRARGSKVIQFTISALSHTRINEDMLLAVELNPLEETDLVFKDVVMIVGRHLASNLVFNVNIHGCERDFLNLSSDILIHLHEPIFIWTSVENYSR